ncbi:MAG: hypothetical protein GF333_05340 [Candidatus Omnitrophica bacterium]|nr:hypothetical protein [Candidatus Omnitrophota bacterium]
MNCENQQHNAPRCSCTYPGCSRKGKCGECIQYHRAAGELPGCLFPPEAEKTYDRSIAHFVAIHSK